MAEHARQPAAALKILVVEDSAADLRLLQAALRDGTPEPPQLRTAHSMAEGV